MNVDYASITLPKKELAEIYRGLLLRHIVENEIRREEGLEEGEFPKVLEAIENAIGLNEEEAHQMLHKMEDELWNFAWYSFTDEWAWFRARQDVLKELGAKRSGTSTDALDRKTEDKYRERFERYVMEIDMHEQATSGKKEKKRASK